MVDSDNDKKEKKKSAHEMFICDVLRKKSTNSWF